MPILKLESESDPETLFEDTTAGAWWVAHVRSRQEKTFGRHLLDTEVPYYLPLREKQVRRAGRNWTSFLPLFPGYVFFRGDFGQRRAALRSAAMVRVLEVLDQESLHSELRELWRLQRAGIPLVPHPYLGPGDRVEVIDGPFKGWTGTILREKGRVRLVVSVTFLKQAVAAEFDRELLAPAAASPRRFQTGR